MNLSHSFSSMKMYDNCPKRYYLQRITKAVSDPGGEASLYGERIHKSFEDRIKHGTPLPPDVAHCEGTVVALETAAKGGELVAELELTLDAHLRPTGWWDADAWMRSKLDVFIRKGSTVFIGDWKTGKRRPDPMQLELFALQAFAHYPDVKTVKSTYFWVKDNATDSATYKRNEAGPMWNKLLAKISRIEQSLETDNWPARPSGLCRFCPARNICEFAN